MFGIVIESIKNQKKSARCRIEPVPFDILVKTTNPRAKPRGRQHDEISAKECVMASKGSNNKPRTRSAPENVETFLAGLEHPFKPELLVLRQIILSADPGITEGIKWNAPSFRTSEYFATLHLRAKDGVQVILHLGAKKRDNAISDGAIADPESLLEWLASDRALAKFRDLKELDAKRSAFAEVIRQWIKHV
jgi:hypothetical protein